MVDVPVVFVVQVYDDFRNVSISPRFDSGYLFGVSLRVLLEEFHIFYVKDVPEVDSRPGAVRTGNLDIISTSSSYDVADGFSLHFAAFFGLRPHGRECSFFSPR